MSIINELFSFHYFLKKVIQKLLTLAVMGNKKQKKCVAFLLFFIDTIIGHIKTSIDFRGIIATLLFHVLLTFLFMLRRASSFRFLTMTVGD